MSRHDTSDLIFRRVLAVFPISVLILVAGIFFELVYSSLPSLQKFGIGFLYHSVWNPVVENFGALPFIYGTCVTSFVALLLAVPIGVGAAIYLAEYAPVKVAKMVSMLVDLLAAIPSVIYGLWGIFVLVPFMRTVIQPFLGKYLGFLPLFQGPNYGIGMLAASVMLAIIIVPFIISVAREVIMAVPFVYKESAYALGATRWEALSNIVLSYGKVGILGAVILALGRAIGEVMAVTMIIGNDPKIALSLFSPGYTLASVLANEFAEADFPMYLSALIEIALVLLLVSFIVNILARLLIWSVTKGQAAEGAK
ncbi:MAG: phosphate ABC transporter permease subunit PstC [Candidatus Omnitrophica bacterium]|nr:phosphate ABC transporter permease subunit PstC [Candidatus Omnitrophota bacterium]MDE2009768.1 phosphate ABC transporter permease subunit PstC [Candidatus Omnitrophota bacterium]MDE2215479.1 phosphate ABC transporter permease subunit PstC [Candidatus Omnitrophota bacterium]MDE2231467.1 phosphate ABC transporter permease subunit PstC [Candidatus Omnitrophota bacterium]